MTTLLALPSEAPGGVDAELAAHFGHAVAFTLVAIDEGRVVGQSVLPAVAHDGNCMLPVRTLAERGVTAIVVYGMGARPLDGFLASGIQPYYAGDLRRVGDAVAAFLRGDLPAFGADRTCGHHHETADCGHQQ